jgi:predicted amidophosphoribosyltransferase
MPLVNCPDCQHQVSSEAFACPNCGKPLKSPLAFWRPFGKRVLILWGLLITMFLVIWLVLNGGK